MWAHNLPLPQSLCNHLAVRWQSQVPCDSFWIVSHGCERVMLFSLARAWTPSFHMLEPSLLTWVPEFCGESGVEGKEKLAFWCTNPLAFQALLLVTTE